MKATIPLTQTEKQFIDDNWQTLTYEEMAASLKFKSVFRIRTYCKQMGYKKERKCLTDAQKDFVRKNLFKMTENMMAKELKVGRSYIQRFKREEGLFSSPGNRERNKQSAKVKEGFFNVSERWNWAV